MGKVAAPIEKPEPVKPAEVMVTATLPVELSVSVCVVGQSTVTLPNEMLAALRPSVDVPAFNCTVKVIELEPEAAVRVADCAVLTEVTVAVNAALVAPAATVTDPGTVTALSQLVRVTLVPPVGAAEFNVTVQTSDPAPVIDAFPQVRLVVTGMPVPLRLAVVVEPLVELLAMVSVPETSPEDTGLNSTVNVEVWPGFSVAGKVPPVMVNPAPIAAAELTVTGMLPVEVSEMLWLAELFTATVPKKMLAALRVRPRVAAFNCTANVADTPP
jgi:hypothetical protein